MVAVLLTSGQWLAEQRKARGWSVPAMRHKLRQAAATAGDNVPDNNCLSVMIHRWEDDRSGISERYRLHYCRAFGVTLESFGKSQPAPAPAADGSCPDDFTATDDMVTRLLPVRVTPGGEELKTAIARLRDPARRDELSFLLGYASAMMAATQTATGQARTHDHERHQALLATWWRLFRKRPRRAKI